MTDPVNRAQSSSHPLHKSEPVSPREAQLDIKWLRRGQQSGASSKGSLSPPESPRRMEQLFQEYTQRPKKGIDYRVLTRKIKEEDRRRKHPIVSRLADIFTHAREAISPRRAGPDDSKQSSQPQSPTPRTPDPPPKKVEDPPVSSRPQSRNSLSRSVHDPSPRRKPSSVNELEKEDPDLFAVLISPRTTSHPKSVEDHKVSSMISKAYKQLMQPLVHTHTNDQPGRKHRLMLLQNKMKIMNFRNDLFHTEMFKLKQPDGELSAQYSQYLYVICKSFLKEYREVKIPIPSEKLLRAQAKDSDEKREHQVSLRRAEVERDSIVQRCIGDICVLADAYKEELALIDADSLKRSKSNPNLDNAQDGDVLQTIIKKVKSIFNRIRKIHAPAAT